VAVQVEDVVLGHGNAGPLPVVGGVSMRDDHVEPVHSATLEEADENWAVEGGGRRWQAAEAERGPSQEERVQPDAEQSDSSRLHEYSSRNSHCLWNSGPPMARPTARARA